MSEAISGSRWHGTISAQLCSRRDLFLHGDSGGSTLVRARRSCQLAPHGIPRCSKRTSFSDRCDRGLAGSLARDVHAPAVRRRLLRTVAPNQGAFQQPNDFDGWPASSPPEWELCPVAKAFLGTYDSRRKRLRPSYRLHPFQPGEARFGVARARLALFIVPPIRPSRIAGRRLGGRLECRRASLRRTRRLTRMSLRSSGLRLNHTSLQHA